MVVAVAHHQSLVFQRRMPVVVAAQVVLQVMQTAQIRRQLVLAVRAAVVLADPLVVESELQVLQAPSTQVQVAAAVVIAITQVRLLPVVPADQGLSLFDTHFPQYQHQILHLHPIAA